MIEAAQMVGVDFILNVVVNEKKDVVKVAAGDVVKAWREAVAVSASLYEVPVKGLRTWPSPAPADTPGT